MAKMKLELTCGVIAKNNVNVMSLLASLLDEATEPREHFSLIVHMRLLGLSCINKV